ncbi:MAG: hypothetical protein PUB12_02860 [[Clostridium] aminophilum]|uniref:hypothetical protein n=1 Tax=[Clostridium] aminophilum TaxID=1526 RepID=UPI0026EBB9FE|nr:hypothetical protein [[Clostridium] aminophilum]MDD6195822.1 hypothetical protein [[Clostridium] aminophilum]
MAGRRLPIWNWNREELLRIFDSRCQETRERENEEWKMVNVARGMAVYDAGEDESVHDVVRRADKKMYENKWERNKVRKRTSAPHPLSPEGSPADMETADAPERRQFFWCARRRTFLTGESPESAR